MSVFEGTQPMLTQVPPMVSASTNATLKPSSAPRTAAANPAEPPPITIRSIGSRLPPSIGTCRSAAIAAHQVAHAVLAVHIVGREGLSERVQLPQFPLQPLQLGDALPDLGGLVLQQIQHHPAGGLPSIAQRQDFLDVVQREVQVACAGHE